MMAKNDEVLSFLTELGNLINQEQTPARLREEAKRFEGLNEGWRKRIARDGMKLGASLSELEVPTYDPHATRMLALFAPNSTIKKIVIPGAFFPAKTLLLLHQFDRFRTLEIAGFEKDPKNAAEALRGLKLESVTFDAALYSDTLLRVLAAMPLKRFICETQGAYRGFTDGESVELSRAHALTITSLSGLEELGLRGFKLGDEVWDTLALGAPHNLKVSVRSSQLNGQAIGALAALKITRLNVQSDNWPMTEEHYQELIGDRLGDCKIIFQ